MHRSWSKSYANNWQQICLVWYDYPLDGLSYTLNAVQCDGFVNITDSVVRAAKNIGEKHASGVSCCDLCDMMQRCFLPPKLDGHVDQSVASMTRLRVMLENGESVLMEDDAPELIVDGKEEGVSRQPLLDGMLLVRD
jgi:hypothetical protein